MPTEYAPADQETMDRLDRVIEEYFPELDALAVRLRIEVLMAATDDDSRPALAKGGHRCGAIIAVVKAEERANGGPDLRLKIDRALWLGEDEEGQDALLHHELMHVVPKYEDPFAKDKVQELDPYGRPVVKLRKDDWMLSGFRRTVEIFGRESHERRALDRVEESLGQRTFAFARAAELVIQQ